jgi:hypothetical protein
MKNEKKENRRITTTSDRALSLRNGVSQAESKEF